MSESLSAQYADTQLTRGCNVHCVTEIDRLIARVTTIILIAMHRHIHYPRDHLINEYTKSTIPDQNRCLSTGKTIEPDGTQRYVALPEHTEAFII